MRIVIISGGDFSYSEKITADDYVICADSGYDSAKENGIHVNLLMGDMDSVKNNISTEKEAILFPERKDFTDTEQPLKVFKTQRYFVNMPMMDMQPDTYKIAVQYLSKTYTTDYNVKISDEPIKSENTDEI